MPVSKYIDPTAHMYRNMMVFLLLIGRPPNHKIHPYEKLSIVDLCVKLFEHSELGNSIKAAATKGS